MAEHTDQEPFAALTEALHDKPRILFAIQAAKHDHEKATAALIEAHQAHDDLKIRASAYFRVNFLGRQSVAPPGLSAVGRLDDQHRTGSLTADDTGLGGQTLTITGWLDLEPVTGSHEIGWIVSTDGSRNGHLVVKATDADASD